MDTNLIPFVIALFGLLFIYVYPKVVKTILFVAIAYSTIMIDLYYGFLFIPYVLLIWYYRRKNG